MTNKNEVGIIRRGIACAADGYICCVLVALVISMFAVNTSNGNMVLLDLTALPPDKALFAGLLAIGICILYYVVVPMFIWSGQTIGKKLCKIKIVDEQNQKCSMISLVKRQFVGLMLIDSYLTASTIFIVQLISISFDANIAKYIEYYFIVMTVVSIGQLFLSKKHSTLHDVIAKTKLIYVGGE